MKYWPCLLFLLAGCTPDDGGSQPLTGYIEGEYRYLAAPVAGYLQELPVARGQHVSAGQLLFRLSADNERYASEIARAQGEAANARADNLDSAQRQPQLAALAANLAAAQAAEQLASQTLQRQQQLAKQGFVSNAVLDNARSGLEQARAQREAASAQLQLARQQIGRPAEVRAARADASASAANRARQDWLLAQREGKSPAGGVVFDSYYRPGEWVAAGQPVLSVLPDDGRLVRFYVAQPQLAQFRPGSRIRVSCEACGQPFSARIDYLSPLAEYTPPQLYNRSQRDKLVFRVEARPDAKDAARLLPGQPVDISAEAGHG